MGNADSVELPKVGYHVLQVQPNSPGANAGLSAYFDFIIAAQGLQLTREDGKFVEILKENVGKPVRLHVYNLKSERIRETVMVPSDSWGGNGLAGISIRFCSFESATDQVWHVLDVYPNSPASAAQLLPRVDFIVGTPEVVFNDSEDFFTFVNGSEGKQIPFYVYNTNNDNIRIIHITPNKMWGGTGSLGCDVGYGYLHRVPVNRNIPEHKPPVPGHLVTTVRIVPTSQPSPYQSPHPHLQQPLQPQPLPTAQPQQTLTPSPPQARPQGQPISTPVVSVATSPITPTQPLVQQATQTTTLQSSTQSSPVSSPVQSRISTPITPTQSMTPSFPTFQSPAYPYAYAQTYPSPASPPWQNPPMSYTSPISQPQFGSSYSPLPNQNISPSPTQQTPTPTMPQQPGSPTTERK